jgi:hypothetical protein
MTFTKIIRTHTRELNVKPKRENTGWINTQIRETIKSRDNLWKKYKNNTSNASFRIQYKELRNKVTTLIRNSKKDYFLNKINSLKNNSREIWKVIDEIVESKKKVQHRRFYNKKHA